MLMLKDGLAPSLRNRRLQADMQRTILKDTAAFHERHGSIVHSIGTSSSRLQAADAKEPGKYYSDRQLELLQQHLNNSSQVKFVSADEFFFNKINNVLRLETDIRHLKSDRGQIAKDDEDLKKQIGDLRLRRHVRHRKTEQLGVDYIKARVELLDRQHLVESRKRAVQLKSQRNTRPTRAPPANLQKPPRPLSSCHTQRNLHSFQTAKDDIETMMEGVTQELKRINSLQAGVLNRRRSLGKASQLAQSVWTANKPQVVTQSLLAAFQHAVP